jgi:hypothetical protein
MKNILIHLFLLVITILIVLGTLFIPQKINDMSKKEVSLGFPIHFITIDLTKILPTYIDRKTQNRTYTITSCWEKRTTKSRVNFLLSFGIVFTILETIVYIINKYMQKHA